MRKNSKESFAENNGILISVLIPVFNSERYIERCIMSVINQTFEGDVECVICDDCSTDGSMKIVRKLVNGYVGRIHFKIVSHNANKGIAVVRNTLLDAASGVYLQFVDSDDYMEPQMLEKMYYEAKTKESDIVICDFYHDYGNYKKRDGIIININCISKEDFLKETIKGSLMRTLWCRLIKSSLFEQYHIRAIEGVDYGEDVLFTIPLSYYANTISCVLVPLYNYSEHTNSITRSRFSDKKMEDRLLVYKIVERFLIARGVLTEYSIDFYKACFKVKETLIKDRKFRNYKMWKRAFPQSNNYIDQYEMRMAEKIYWKTLLKAPSIIRPLWYLVADIVYKRLNSKY